MRARFAAAFVLGFARGAFADDTTEDVHVRGEQAQGFESRAKLDDASREITDAAGLVEPLVGVHVRRLGADDGFATMSIRGSSSNQVSFYLAGVPLPAAADPTVDLATLPLWPGSQARVFRTFAPAALGAGSLGGTLALDAPSATGPERTDIWIAGGSFGALRMRLGDVSDLGGGVRIATGLSASRSDGDFSFYNIDHNAPISDPREFIPRINGDFAQASGLVSLVVPLHMGASQSGTMRATVMVQERDQGLPGSIFAATPFERLRSDRELGTVELAMPVTRGVATFQAWGVRQGTDFRNVPSDTLDPTLERTTIATAGANVGTKLRFGDVTLAGKLDARAERYAPGDYAGPSPPTGATRAAFGAGIDGDWRVSRAVTLAAAARIDAWNDASDDANAASLTARPTAHLGVDATNGVVSVTAHAGYTSRAANFIERFGAPGGFIPNPTLLPESALSADAGVRFKKKFGALRLQGELDGFAQAAQDLIVFEYVSARGLPHATNVGQATIAGVEAEVEARIAGFELRASYTGLHTENHDADCSAGCPQLVGRPAHDFVVDLAYTLGPIRFRYGIDGVIGTTADSAGTIEVPARVLQSVGARLDVPRLPGVRLAVDIRNLFDVRTLSYPQTVTNTSVPYPVGDVYYFPLPGRSFLVSLAWTPRTLTGAGAP